MSQTATKTCYHCGEDCQDEELELENHTFCCHGCKTVYTLLQDTGLHSYYEIESTPGRTIKKTKESRDFLDSEEVKSRLIAFTEGSQNKVTLYLPSMHCAACIWLLEKLPKLNKGVIKSEVNFLKKEISILFDSDQVSLKELVIQLEDLGYSPDLQRKKGEKTNMSQREDMLKLGVAGFAFGNIMLFSFPDYLSLDDASLDGFKTLFGYLNIGLSLPVLLYCDVQYFKSAYQSLKLKYLTIDVPIALGIVTLFGRSLFEILTETGSGYLDSFAGLVFFLLIGKWFQNKTYDALAFDRDFKSYFPIAVSRINGDVEEVCMLENIKISDTLNILNNQVIPADSLLLSSHANIDYSFVSGESDLVKKAENEIVYAGGRNMGTSIQIKVVKDVSQGYLTSLWNNADSRQQAPKVASMVDNVSKYFSGGILSIAALTLIFWLIADARVAINAFTAVLIIACPCALALSMPFTAGNVSRILGKLGVFIKNSNVLERTASVNTIVFDKTGTLTNASDFEITYVGDTLSDDQLSLVKSVVSQSTHPLSHALSNHLKQPKHKILHFENHEGIGIEGSVNGRNIKIGKAAFCLTKEVSADRLGSKVYINIDSVFFGCFLLIKKERLGVKSMIEKVNSMYTTYLISGDNESEKESMVALFSEESNIYFNQSPKDKKEFVEVLSKSGNNVMMVGDGLNDAGALRSASVGIAVADDVFSFSPACDVIIQANQLQHLDRIIEFIKKSMAVVKASVVLSLLYNSIGLFFAVRGELTPIVAAVLMPLSSVSVVLFVTLLTNWLAPKVDD